RPPLQQVNDMPAAAYFAAAAELLKLHPPHLTDWSTLARMRRIGIHPGQSFEFDRLDPAAQGALERVPADTQKLMQDKLPTLAREVHGGEMNNDTVGVYGNFYLKRAIVAMVGLGANPPEDAVYPLNVADARGRPLTGDRARPHRRPGLPAPLRQGRAAAGGGVLVGHHVRRRRLPGRQPAQPLRHRRPRRPC